MIYNKKSIENGPVFFKNIIIIIIWQVLIVGELAGKKSQASKKKKVHSISLFHMMERFMFNIKLPSFLNATIDLYFFLGFLHLNRFCLFDVGLT